MTPQGLPTAIDVCPGREQLLAYSLGTLNRQAIENIAGHLEHCPSCMAALQKLADRSDPLVRSLASLRDDDSVTSADDEHIIANLAAIRGDQPPPLPSPPPRQIGPYEILEPLAQGGMGAVYKARHTHLDKIVAVKLLSAERVGDDVAIARFIKEMKALGQLSHPNIVQAFDAGVESVPYLAMEFLEGMDLSRYVRERGPMPVAQACECIRQAALALQHASAAGLVHRDIKPSNLMLTPDGCVKVLDLGLARLGPDLPREGYQDTREGPITSAGAVMGTMDYIAPEQLLDSRAVDSRTDLYSLGCTLYYLLTGGPPFGGSQEGSSGKRIAHLTKPFPDVRAARPDVPPDLSVIVDRLLAKNPDFRFSTPAELSAALVPFSFGGGLKGLTRTAAQIAETPPRKSIVAPSSTGAPTKPPHLVAWSVLAAVFLATIAVGIFILVVRNQRDNGGFGGPDQSRSNLIQALQVDHFRRVDAELHGLGLIGVKDAVRQGKDSFRVTGQLTQPAHLYLFAYFPDGKNFLCWPDEDAAPEATRTMVYPAHGVLPFNETGMHMFVLVAARKPLPAFDRWRPRPINWPKHEAQPVGAWKFTGRQFVGMQPEIGMPVPDACKEVCAALAARPDLDAVQAVAFSVLPDVPLK